MENRDNQPEGNKLDDVKFLIKVGIAESLVGLALYLYGQDAEGLPKETLQHIEQWAKGIMVSGVLMSNIGMWIGIARGRDKK